LEKFLIKDDTFSHKFSQEREHLLSVIYNFMSKRVYGSGKIK